MIGELSKQQPKTLMHFKAFMGSVLNERVLDIKTKELNSVGTAITAQSRYCIVNHIEKTLDKLS
jgi:alkylhydroperoxidase/carboxymuconolactone decarboxylase family protein YurZ